MGTVPSVPFDPTKAAAFAGRFVNALNDAALCLMVSIGHRLGLLDAMRDHAPETSVELARRTRLNERYVREWLGALATSGVLEVDADGPRFRLPDEHAACLTRPAGADNLASFAQYIPILGMVEEEILTCFREGGGVPYEKYLRFHEVMAEDSGQGELSVLEKRILPLVPGLTERLRAGIDMLDLGCGRGLAIIRLAELFPASRFTGMDLSREAIEWARAEAVRRGVADRARFLVVDLSDFDAQAEPARYDFVTTFDAVHDQAKPMALLKGIHRTLRPEGIYVMQDIKGSSHVHENLDHPMGTLLYTVSCLHCMTVSLAQGGEGLGAMWGEQKAREYVMRAGFRSFEKHELAHDLQNNWYVIRTSGGTA
jgi:2-polyprenyl-3-methyl-5-hydroxy-6-metoxy-1,4-benzoquinol methylase